MTSQRGLGTGSTSAPLGKRPGRVLALLGGLLTGLAYLLMPVATVPLIGSLAAPGLATQATGVVSLRLLPAVPVAAVAVIVIGLWLLVARPGPGPGKIAAWVLLGCAALIAVAYLWPFVRLSDELSRSGAAGLGISATTFTGAGFWCVLIGALLTAVGAAVELSWLSRAA